LSFTFYDRLNQFLRSLSIQGSWNFPRMQGLGFFYSLLPWLSKASGEGFKEACHRHLGYFNTNPYMSPYILGVVSRLEEEGRGEESVKARNSLMGPLGAIGDGYYWAALLPVTVLLGIALSFFWIAAAPVLFLLLYNVVHLRNRWVYLNCGYLNAHSPLEGAAEINGKTLSRNMERLVTPLLGFILGLAAFGTRTPGTALLVFAIALLMFRRQFRTPAIFALLVTLGTLLGFLGTDMRIPWSG
jgi:mannose/fructose/N-acetylgalactosamine-specific phosphotransferase system component IID